MGGRRPGADTRHITGQCPLVYDIIDPTLRTDARDRIQVDVTVAMGHHVVDSEVRTVECLGFVLTPFQCCLHFETRRHAAERVVLLDEVNTKHRAAELQKEGLDFGALDAMHCYNTVIDRRQQIVALLVDGRLRKAMRCAKPRASLVMMLALAGRALETEPAFAVA